MERFKTCWTTAVLDILDGFSRSLAVWFDARSVSDETAGDSADWMTEHRYRAVLQVLDGGMAHLPDERSSSHVDRVQHRRCADLPGGAAGLLPAIQRKTVVVNSRVTRTRDGRQAVTHDTVIPLMLDVKPS